MTFDDDISTADALRLLARAEHDENLMDRRRFLSIIGAGLGVGILPSTLFEWAATNNPTTWTAGPLAEGERVVILVGMWGGNDSLNTVVPFNNGLYYDQHGALALLGNDTLTLDSDRGLHPGLSKVKSFWDDGHLAVIEGIGYPNPNLSHFDSMAKWMSGRPVGTPDTGWVGRWLDEYLGGQPDLFAGLEVGGASLLMRGVATQGTSVPVGRPTFGVDASARAQRLYAAMRDLGADPTNTWRGRVGAATRSHLDVNATIAPVVPAQIAGTEIVGQLEMIGHIVNANLGFRVLAAGWNDFDSHAAQPTMHTARMSELNTGLERLFEVLTAEWADRVTVVTYSEFGRTSWANDGDGTDHGTAGTHFVIGSNVKGGFYGQAPTLAGLGRWDRMAYHVDYRDYFGSVLDGCLGGGGSAAFDGRPVQDLGLFVSVEPPPSTTIVTTTQPTTEPGGDGLFVPIYPTRVFDTRSGLGGHLGRLQAAETIDVQIGGLGGVPASGASAVALNVTSVNSSTNTNFRVFPTGSALPGASSLNPAPGRAVPNMVVVGLGDGGAVSVYNELGTVDCIVDVVGYFGSNGGSGLMSVVPSRVLDTRSGNGAPAAPVSGGSTLSLQVTGRGGVPVNGVEAVVMNVTTVSPSTNGFVTVWAAGAAQPGVSNLNYVKGRNIPNMVVCEVGDGGKVNMFAQAGAVHLLADVVGYFTSGGDQHTAVAPERLLDTRTGLGASKARVPAGGELVVQVAGVAGVPAEATTALVNITAVKPSADTFITVYPEGVSRPVASSLNVKAGGIIANLVAVKIGVGGGVRLYNYAGSVDLIADVSGYFI